VGAEYPSAAGVRGSASKKRGGRKMEIKHQVGDRGTCEVERGSDLIKT